MQATAERRSIGRWVVLGVIVALVVMWAYIFWFQWSGRGKPLNRLDDETWAPAAEAICAPVREAMFALPSGDDFEGRSLAERADVLDQVTAMYTAMIADLQALPSPASAKDQEILRQWFGDWQIYFDSRDAHAAKLRAGEDARFALLADEPIDGRIEFFVETNRMESCNFPGDV